MKFKYDNYSKEELEQKLIQLRLESEESILKTEAKIEAIRKEREESKLKNEAEIEAIRKEREESKLKTEAEIEAIRKEREESKLKTEAEIEAIRKEREESKQKTDAEIEILRKESESIRKETDILRKKNEIELERLMVITGATNSKLKGVEDNIGYGVEEIFFESINKTKQIGKIIYDVCTPKFQLYNVKNKSIGEIDILLTNGKEVGIIEIKHRIGIKAIEQLIKNAHLFELNNNKKKYKINVYIAGLSIHSSARHAIKNNKIKFIKIRGEHFELVDI